MKLEKNQWRELRADKEHSLYLTPAQVEAAHGKGYVLKNRKFVSANKTVAKAWNHLNRGKDLQNYAQMVSEASQSNDVMQLYFGRSQPNTPTLRSLVLDGIGSYSKANGDVNLDYYIGRLVGVAQEMRKIPHFCAEKKSDVSFLAPEAHVAREKSSPQSIVQPTLEQTLAVINNPDLNRKGMAKAVSKLFKS